MGYGTDGLTFNTLRGANLVRLPLFRNGKGETAHEKADGSDWSANDWAVAALGELGELANVLKKVRRGDMTLDEARQMLADELADTVIYLDLLAYRLNVDLGDAVMAKWNETSVKVGVDLSIDAEGWHRYAAHRET